MSRAEGRPIQPAVFYKLPKATWYKKGQSQENSPVDILSVADGARSTASRVV